MLPLVKHRSSSTTTKRLSSRFRRFQAITLAVVATVLLHISGAEAQGCTSFSDTACTLCSMECASTTPERVLPGGLSRVVTTVFSTYEDIVRVRRLNVSLSAESQRRDPSVVVSLLTPQSKVIERWTLSTVSGATTLSASDRTYDFPFIALHLKCTSPDAVCLVAWSLVYELIDDDGDDGKTGSQDKSSNGGDKGVTEQAWFLPVAIVVASVCAVVGVGFISWWGITRYILWRRTHLTRSIESRKPSEEPSSASDRDRVPPTLPSPSHRMSARSTAYMSPPGARKPKIRRDPAAALEHAPAPPSASTTPGATPRRQGPPRAPLLRPAATSTETRPPPLELPPPMALYEETRSNPSTQHVRLDFCSTELTQSTSSDYEDSMNITLHVKKKDSVRLGLPLPLCRTTTSASTVSPAVSIHVEEEEAHGHHDNIIITNNGNSNGNSSTNNNNNNCSNQNGDNIIKKSSDTQSVIPPILLEPIAMDNSSNNNNAQQQHLPISQSVSLVIPPDDDDENVPSSPRNGGDRSTAKAVLERFDVDDFDD
eukprot:PhM_4_TR1215/c0_g2_i1/m.18983